MNHNVKKIVSIYSIYHRIIISVDKKSGKKITADEHCEFLFDLFRILKNIHRNCIYFITYNNLASVANPE